MEAEEEVVGGGAKVSPQQCEKKKTDLELDPNNLVDLAHACQRICQFNALMMSIVVEGSGGQCSLCMRNTRETNGEVAWGKNLRIAFAEM